MKGIIESLRSILKFVLLFCEIVIGILIAYNLVYAVILSTWTEFFILYIFFAILSFTGYCLGRVIAIGKDIKFMSMLKGLIIAPLFFIYLVYKQIRSPYLLGSQPTSASSAVENDEDGQFDKNTDTRKKDAFNVELQNKLNRIEYDLYHANQRYNTVKVTVKGRLRFTVGFGVILIKERGELVFTVDAYEDGEIYEPGVVSFDNFVAEITKEANESIRSQIEEIISELQKKYNNYDEIRKPNRNVVYYTPDRKYNRCIKRQSY